MISVKEAKDLIFQHSLRGRKEKCPLNKAIGKILFEDIISPQSLPPFHQSAMDGYAIRFNNGNPVFEEAGTVAAGSIFRDELAKGNAVRIFTGAQVPAGTDAIIMQEKVKIEGKKVKVSSADLVMDANIRKKGSQINKGEKALSSGTKLNPAAIGFIASMGIQNVTVYSDPKINIIVTGSELQKAGEQLEDGKIYESNGVILLSAIQQTGIRDVNCHFAKDDLAEITSVLEKVSKDSDLVLFSGGISVGDYDFVQGALNNTGVKTIFYKVKQKPGKPLYFGVKGSTIYFALPGNPAAVLTCFYEYVYPAIRKMQGFSEPELPVKKMSVTGSFTKKKGLSFFLKAKIDGNSVTLLEGQESYILKSFANANCLVCVEEETESINKGDLVDVHLLPGI